MAARSFLRIFSVFFALICVGALTGCVSNVENESRTVQSWALPAKFSDNTKTFITNNANEKALIAIISNNLKPGLEALDLKQIAPVLASSYELQYAPAATKLLSEPLSTFLQSRSDWLGQLGKVREVAYAIQDIQIDQSQSIGAVIAYTTYKSKYFSPHFLETLLFEKNLDNWKVVRQTMVPIVHDDPKDLHVNIFLAAPQRGLNNRFADISLARGADHWVDKYLQKSVSGILTDRRRTSVLFVFSEPPAIGTKITIEHSWWSPVVQHPPAKELHYVVENSQPYFIIENFSWVGCCAGDTATYKVFVNGNKIAEKDVLARD